MLCLWKVSDTVYCIMCMYAYVYVSTRESERGRHGKYMCLETAGLLFVNLLTTAKPHCVVYCPRFTEAMKPNLFMLFLE